VILLHNQICFGGPMEIGYSIGGSVRDLFSLKFIFDPPVLQMDQNPWPILRATLGLGRLHPWPIAVAALFGAACAWSGRRASRGPWALTILTVVLMTVQGSFLSLYFYRSPLYLTLYLPLLVVLAGAMPTGFLQRIQARHRWNVPWLPTLPLLLALAYVAPELPEAPLLQEADENANTKGVHVFRSARATLEENAVLIGAASPLVGQYVFASRGQRVYHFLGDLLGGLRRRPLKDHEAREILEEVARFITRMQGAGRPVYILVLPPEDPEKIQICRDAYLFLRDRFRLVPSPLSSIVRVSGRR